MNKIENLVQELKELGFDDEKIAEIMQIGGGEIVDIVLEDFAFNGDKQSVQDYLPKFEAAKDNPQEFNKLLHEVMTLHYGSENVDKQKEELLVEYLQNVINLTKETAEIRRKYEQGDPETVKAIQEAQNSPIIQDMAKKMDEENPTPQDNG